MDDFYLQIVDHLEIAMKSFDLIQNVFIFKNKTNKLIGFEVSEDDEPLTAKSSDSIEIGTIIELYIEAKKNLGFSERKSMLKALRLSNQLTQTDIGRLLGRTKQEINRWENVYDPPVEIIEEITRKLSKK